MTNNELYEFLYDWVELVLDPSQKGTPPIIQSHENAPAPKIDTNYVTIQYNGDRQKIGRPSKKDVDETTGIRQQVYDYEITVNLFETYGSGDLLNTIINSVETFTVLQLFRTNCVSYMGEANAIQDIPRKMNERWVREQFVTVRLMLPLTIEEEVGVIETVTGTGTVEAQGRSGNHTIENNIGGSP